MKKFLTISVSLFLVCSLVECTNNDVANEIPSYISICNQTDPNLGACIRKSILNLRTKLQQGIPELGVPSLEPLIIPEIAIDKIDGIQMQAKFRNVTIAGPSRFRLRSVKSQIESDKLLMKLWFPELIIKGSYEIRGQILMMPINGSGTCFGNFSDIDGLLRTKLKRIRNENSSKEHYQVETIYIEFNIGQASQISLDNLFRDDMEPARALELSAAMNSFINENWRIVAAALKPTLETVIAEALREIADKIFAKYPIDSLLVS